GFSAAAFVLCLADRAAEGVDHRFAAECRDHASGEPRRDRGDSRLRARGMRSPGRVAMWRGKQAVDSGAKPLLHGRIGRSIFVGDAMDALERMVEVVESFRVGRFAGVFGHASVSEKTRNVPNANCAHATWHL